MAGTYLVKCYKNDIMEALQRQHNASNSTTARHSPVYDRRNVTVQMLESSSDRCSRPESSKMQVVTVVVVVTMIIIMTGVIIANRSLRFVEDKNKKQPQEMWDNALESDAPGQRCSPPLSWRAMMNQAIKVASLNVHAQIVTKKQCAKLLPTHSVEIAAAPAAPTHPTPPNPTTFTCGFMLAQIDTSRTKSAAHAPPSPAPHNAGGSMTLRAVAGAPMGDGGRWYT
jgi:hypothetical protein